MNTPSNYSEEGEKDDRPDWIKNNEKGRGKIEVDGETYPYTIMDQELEGAPPNFVGFLDAKFLFISEEVLPQYRNHFLRHEVICNKKLQGRSGRCEQATKRELEQVPEEIKEDYIKFRIKFYEDLIDYQEKHDNDELVKELKGSLNYLRILS